MTVHPFQKGQQNFLASAHHESFSGSYLLVAALATSILFACSRPARKASRQRDFKCGYPHPLSCAFACTPGSYSLLFVWPFTNRMHSPPPPSFSPCSSPLRSFKKATRNFACLTRTMTTTSVLVPPHLSFLSNLPSRKLPTLPPSQPTIQILLSLRRGWLHWAITPTKTSSTDFSKSAFPL